MFDIFGSVKSLLKVQTVHIDNNIFRLHYQVTVFVLVLFSILVVSRQYFGDPIDCTFDDKDKVSHVMDNYCWMHSYIDPSIGKLYQHDIHPGIATYTVKEKVEQRYYQWVGFILFFQALLFFIPRYLWKQCWEEGKIKGLANGLKGPVIDSEVEIKRKKMIVLYFQRNIGHHNFYFFKYFVCEVLNLANVLFQMALLNEHLDLMNFSWKFFTLPIEASQTYFPKVAKCDFAYFSTGGAVRSTSSLCVLPVNIFNEKIFAYMWIWFTILALLSFSSFVYRLLTVIPSVRAFLLQRRTRCVNPKVVRALASKIEIGDWFLLFQIGKNVDPFVFGELLKDLCNLECMKSWKKSNSNDYISVL